ncbi:MAG: hypothetical protein ABIQ95_13155 [Bdellovibrionia bacterium]
MGLDCGPNIRGAGIQITLPSTETLKIRQQTEKFLPCLGSSGLVASHLVGLVPMEKIWTDRIPRDPKQWDKIDYVLLSPQIELFGMPSRESRALFERLSVEGSGFVRDRMCSGEGELSVYLFVRQNTKRKPYCSPSGRI